jgi:hypothetical protein
MWSKTTVRKAAALIVILYRPGGTDRSETSPDSLVSAVNSWFVALCNTVTLTPGTTSLSGLSQRQKWNR